jgi:hypothetical protein
MRAQILSICIAISLILVGCESGTDKNKLPESVQPQAENSSQPNSPIPQNIDKPKLSVEEASLIIYSNLNNNLPADYKAVKLDRSTRSARYINNGKWEFHVIGSGESRTSLPEEKVEESEILWRINQKEQITSYDISLMATYYENLQICEINSIEKYNIITENKTLYSNEMNATLRVTLVKYTNYSVQINVQNSGLIPIHGIKLLVSYTDTINFVKFFDGVLYPDGTTTFIITFQDSKIPYNNEPYYPNYIKFFTGSGLQIPRKN